MGPGALCSLPLLLLPPLLLVATGHADMKGHFDPGEKTGSWVPEDGAWETEPGALTLRMPVFTQPSAAMPWACRTGPFQMGTSLPPALGQTPLRLATAGNWHTWGAALEGAPVGPLPALPSPLPKPRGFWEGQCQCNPTPHREGL